MKKEEEEYLNREQGKLAKFGENTNKAANEIFRDLNKQLILVATVLLSISFLLIKETDLVAYQKHILFFSWVFSGFSIVFGIIQFFNDYYFFRKICDGIEEVIYSLSKKIINTKKELEISLENKNGLFKNSILFTYLQSVFLFLGLSFLITLASTLIF
jgi:hypothetical protein